MLKMPTAIGVIMSPFMPAKLRAAIYVRKSNKDNEGRTKSRDEQLEHSRLVCQHYGLEVSEERIYIEDLGWKGEHYWDDGTERHPKPYRPELTRLMRDIEAGLVDVLVIWRSDRLYRDSGVCDALMQSFRKHGTRFISGGRELDVSSSSGLYQASTEAANNRRWRDQISEDIKRDHQFKAELGMFTRNPSCLGFRSKGRKSQDVEFVYEELDLALRCFTLCARGEGDCGPLGEYAIARYLMDEGVRWPKGSKGHKIKLEDTIHGSQVGTVLRNCVYVSRWRHNGQEYDCPRLMVPVLDENGNPTGERRTAVPVALYEEVQAKLARQERPGKRSLGDAHLSTGLTVCARCGRPLHVQQTHGKIEKGPRKGERRPPVLKLHCAHKRGTRPCPSSSAFGIQEQVLDDWILEVLAPALVAEMEGIRASASRAADVEDLARVERKLAEARKRESTKLRMLVDALDAEQYGVVAAQLRAEREALARQVKNLKDRIDNVERFFPDLSEDTLRSQPKSALKEALSRAIAWIAVGRAGTGIVLHTRWGSYLGAEFRKGDPELGETRHKTYIDPPTPIASLQCLQWIPDPAEFVRGRRDSLGKSAEGLTDEELLPGFEAATDPDGDVLVDPCEEEDK